MAYFNGYTPQQSHDLYGTTGTSDDWAYGVLGIASYTIEMGTDFFQDCASFESTIYPNNLQCHHGGLTNRPACRTWSRPARMR